jgi:hypothetical protein
MNNPVTALLDFLHEAWIRFTMKSPAFARVIQKISTLVSLLIGVALYGNAQMNWGWEMIIVIKALHLSLTALLVFVIFALGAVVGTAQLSVEDKTKLEYKVRDNAPSAPKP